MESRVKPQEHKLLIQVFDENRLTRDDFLGMVELPLASAPAESAAAPRPPAVKYALRPRSARSRVRGHIEVYHALVGRVGEPGTEEPAAPSDWEMELTVASTTGGGDWILLGYPEDYDDEFVVASATVGDWQMLSLPEPDDDDFVTAATEFQRRFHISHDSDERASPAPAHQGDNNSGEGTSYDATPLTSPVRSPQPSRESNPELTEVPQTSSLSNTCDSNLREEDDVVCANEVRLKELEGDNETDDVAQDCDNATSSQNEAPAEAAGQSESAVAHADQSDGAEQKDKTDEAIERESDAVNDNARTNLETADVSETAPTEAENEINVENTAEIETTNVEQEASNAEHETGTVVTETHNADAETQNVDTVTDVDADAHFVDAESTSVAVERVEIEELEEALTFDENHFSTPTGGATPERVATGRRMTSSSMDDTEDRITGSSVTSRQLSRKFLRRAQYRTSGSSAACSGASGAATAPTCPAVESSPSSPDAAPDEISENPACCASPSNVSTSPSNSGSASKFEATTGVASGTEAPAEVVAVVALCSAREGAAAGRKGRSSSSLQTADGVRWAAVDATVAGEWSRRVE
ncbi:hypothetical protein MSG28_008971 [Choristoneura fumiferana]|uniref:Uncharacterized protein n=1 Tax=Choristoneura fumiferana TaxID=7141 RepID=A0ACC0J8N1_CHOFU|nr:hypothetical protein MSG28_008971 [Choristoneura fumiferana]